MLDKAAVDAGGVESTTRFRKPMTGRGIQRSEGGTSRRQRAGARGGRASRTLRQRRRPADATPSTLRQSSSNTSSPSPPPGAEPGLWNAQTVSSPAPTLKTEPSLFSAQTTSTAWTGNELKVGEAWDAGLDAGTTAYPHADLPTPISDGFDHDYQKPMNPGNTPNSMSPSIPWSNQPPYGFSDIVGTSAMMNQPSIYSQAYDYAGDTAPIYGPTHGLTFSNF